MAALLPPFSRPTPSKWDDAEKWISSPTSNRTGRAGPTAGTVPKKFALAFPEHGGRPPAVAKVVTDVPTNTGPLVKNSDGKHELCHAIDFFIVFSTYRLVQYIIEL